MVILITIVKSNKNFGRETRKGLIVAFIFVIIGAANMQNLAHLGGLFSILAAFALLLALVLLIYNVAMGIAVLLGRKPQDHHQEF